MSGQCRKTSLQAATGITTRWYQKGFAPRFPVSSGPDAPLVLTAPHATTDKIKASGDLFTLCPGKGKYSE